MGSIGVLQSYKPQSPFRRAQLPNGHKAILTIQKRSSNQKRFVVHAKAVATPPSTEVWCRACIRGSFQRSITSFHSVYATITHHAPLHAISFQSCRSTHLNSRHLTESLFSQKRCPIYNAFEAKPLSSSMVERRWRTLHWREGWSAILSCLQQ